MKKIIKTGLFILAFLSQFSAITSAKEVDLSGDYKDLKFILIHGFDPEVIKNKIENLKEIENRSQIYWQDYWWDKASHHIYWDSGKRIVQNRRAVVEQLEKIMLSKSCNRGCMFVTHSTGDLVLRDLLASWKYFYLEKYLSPAFKDYAHILPYYNNEMRLYGSLDFAGAGGGSELAETAVTTAAAYPKAKGFQKFLLDNFSPEVKALKTQFGRVPKLDEMGVQIDLIPSVARRLSVGNSPIPRLRIVGGGRLDSGGFLGSLSSQIVEGILPGMDDGVVAAHSACGASKIDAYDTCLEIIHPDGLLYSHRSAAPRSYYHNHYPIYMGESYDHSDLLDGKSHGKIVTSRFRVDRDYSFHLGMAKPEISYEKSSRGWHATVKNGDSQHIGEVILQTIRKLN